jgi:hypothetical protein
METELFGVALGVEDPLYIDEIVFDSASSELHIRMNFRAGGRFS